MQLLERKRPKVVAVALANKTARIAWAVMARGEGESYAARCVDEIGPADHATSGPMGKGGEM
jgi:transposase